MTADEMAKVVVDAAIEGRRTLGGPGLLETVYEVAAFDPESRGLTVVCPKIVPLVYKGKSLAPDLRLNLLVDERVIVERKVATAYNRVFEAQALTCLRLSALKLAIVIDSGEVKVSQGIRRVVNGLRDRASSLLHDCAFAPWR